MKEETEEAAAGSEKKTGNGKSKERKDSVNDSSVSVVFIGAISFREGAGLVCARY